MLYFIKDTCCWVMLLLSSALKILPLAAATQQTQPYFQSCRGGFCCRGWRGEKNDARQNASPWLRSQIQGRICPPAPWVLPAVPVCDAASGSVHHPSEACIPQWQNTCALPLSLHSLVCSALGEILAGCFLLFT